MPADDQTLERLMQFLRRFYLVRAEGGTTNFDSDRVSHGKTEGKPPPPAGDELRALEAGWAGCNTTADRRAVLKRAIEDIEIHNNPKPDPDLVRDTEEWRKVIAADPRPSRKVAKTYEVSHNTVCRFRRLYAAEREAGKPPPPPTYDPWDALMGVLQEGRPLEPVT